MYGTQATDGLQLQKLLFENDVKMYGTQAEDSIWKKANGLRMM